MELGTDASDDVWIFAYGSLMWQPNFTYAETIKARLFGWHRSMCILSHVYRGTCERPGLVLGLDRGGSCQGMAFRVSGINWPSVKDLLNGRELVNSVYRAGFMTVHLSDGRKVTAYAFIADRTHSQYWRGSAGEAAHLIRQGHGENGCALEYFLKTVEELRLNGIQDAGLLKIHRAIAINGSNS